MDADLAFSVQGLATRSAAGVSFRDLVFQVRRGEAVGITAIGAADLSGLLAVLAGFEKPDAGEIRWDGLSSVHIETASSPRLRYRLEREQRLKAGFLTVAANLLNNLSLFDNIALPLRYHFNPPSAAVTRRVGPLMETLRLSEDAFRRPAGLPRGVRRSAQLARAMVMEPPLLFLDGRFLDTDPVSVSTMIAALKNWLAEGKLTLVASAHDVSLLLTLVTRLLVLHDGKLQGSLGAADLARTYRSNDPGSLLGILEAKQSAPP